MMAVEAVKEKFYCFFGYCAPNPNFLSQGSPGPFAQCDYNVFWVILKFLFESFVFGVWNTPFSTHLKQISPTHVSTFWNCAFSCTIDCALDHIWTMVLQGSSMCRREPDNTFAWITTQRSSKFKLRFGIFSSSIFLMSERYVKMHRVFF